MNCHRCATPLPENSRFCLSCGADVSGDSLERTQSVEDDPELRNKLQAEIGPDFLIERELGRGGMAIVYLATEVHLGRKVAVKVLPPELTKLASTGLVERFKREARTAATLDHPHIIPIFRVSTGGTLLWYVMKCLEGEALDDLLKREKHLPLARIADILKQTAEALAYAHRKNVIHRDVKPANVMLDESGWVTVTDFGIAKALDTSSLTGSGSMIGTPYYMSPEQCSGTKITGASDQYSLAVMAYQMVSGHLPFTGDSIVQIVKKHCMEPPPPLSVLTPAVPSAVIAVVERGLAKSAEERYPSVTDFTRAFENAAAGTASDLAERTADAGVPERQRPSETALASPIPEGLRLQEPLPPAPPAPAPPPPAPAPRRRVGFVVGAAAVVAVAAGIGVALWRPWQGDVPQAAQEVRLAAADSPAVTPPTARPDTTTTAAQPAAPGAPAAALLVLRGVPAGATTTVDGRMARGSRVPLTPGPRHIVTVAAVGFEVWADTIRAQAGDTITRTVRSSRLPSAPAAAARSPAVQTQSVTGQPSPGQAPPTQAAPQLQPTAPAPQPTAPSGTAYITVGSRPLATLTVNGRPVPNPASRYEVPAGPVRLHFVVTDSTGIWSFDTAVTVTAGEVRNLGRIPLVRRP